ncbi:MAG: rod shape-determining protein RodA [Candidatus Uhrbacteria bacterium]|nr:rod shape-determining protein RodA [Candidatus Uhrbacteria bacterium]
MQVSRPVQQLQRFDWILLFSALVLFAFGIAAIYSVELSRESADFLLLKKHLIALGVGTVALLIMANANFLQLRSYGRILYLLGVVLMIAVLIFGSEIRGTTGWFDFGVFSFQPVEFMKIALAVELARFFSERARRRFGWKEIFGSGALVAIPVVLTAIQPDLGSAFLLVGMWVILMFFAGLRWHHATVLGVLVVLFAIISWSFLLHDYQKERLAVFINPDLDPLESGYNINQAKIAIGSGQLFGRGLGFGSQSQLKFLPESQTDFVFAVIAEELGFFGVLVILTSIGVFLSRALLLAYRGNDHFTTFLAIAIFGALFVQMSVNIGVNLAIFPATGVGLPFVSYGGSSLVMSFFMLGILESVAVRLRPGDRMERTWYN